jgi:hypothetical protein
MGLAAGTGGAPMARDRDPWVPQMIVTPGTRNPWAELGRQECAWRSGVYLGVAILAGQEAVSVGSPAAPQEPPGEPTALAAHVTGTQRDVMAFNPRQYVLIRHRLAVTNSRSTR